MQSDTDTNSALALLAYQEAPIGLVLTERRTIRTCNQTFANMFGFARSQLIGQSFRMLYSSRHEFDKIRDIGIKPLKEKGIYSDERIMQRRDGTRFWCRFRAHTLTRNAPLDRTILSFALISDTVPNVILTPRERQVVLLLSKGMTSKEAARDLAISPRTVEDFRARLLKKFKARNTAELLAQLTGIED
jgi:PAS domain S-box-containing protein